MPKARRVRPVHLTAVKKQGLARKEALVENIHDAFATYKNVLVLAVHNMRTAKMNELREKFHESRFFLGKNKVMHVAVGRTPEEEHAQNSSLLVPHLIGQCCLLFTNDDPVKVRQFFSDFGEYDFARAGFIASDTVSYDAGPLTEFSHAMQPYLSKLGMPVSLVRGVVTLDRPFTVCTAGQPLTADQAHILKLLNIKQAQFAFTVTAQWTDGDFKALADPVAVAKGSVTGEVLPANRSNDVSMSNDTNSVRNNDDDDDDDDDVDDKKPKRKSSRNKSKK